MKKLFLLSLLVLGSFFGVKAQTTLAQGDIAFLGIYSGGSSTAGANPKDSVMIITLVDLQAGTVFKFTDNGILNTSGVFTFCTNEAPAAGVIVTCTSAVPKGTVFRIATNVTSTTSSVSTFPTANLATCTGAVDLAAAGDQLHLYQSSGTTTSTQVPYSTANFLTAISTREFQTTAVTTCSGFTAQTILHPNIPSSNAIFASVFPSITNYGNFFYDPANTGAINVGTKTALYTAIMNRANWSANSSAPSWPWNRTYTITAAALPEPTNHVSSFAVTTAATTSNTITLTWNDNQGTNQASGYLLIADSVSYANIATPVDGTPVANSALVANISPGTQTYTFTGLNQNKDYFFKIFPYSNASTAIDYKTGGTIPQVTTKTLVGYSIMHQELFTVCPATWTGVSFSDPLNTWNCSGGIVQINGFGGTTGAQQDSDILISPSINMNLFTNEILEVQHDEAFTGPNVELWYSNNFNGSYTTTDVASATWTYIGTLPERTSGNSFIGYANNTFGIDSITGPNVYFAFRYIADGTSGGSESWRLDNIYVKGLSPGAATIATGTLSSNIICVSNTQSATISVPFTTLGTFNAGNTFSVELSNSTGGFGGNIIGTGTSSPIYATIPAGTNSGTGYRVRVISNDPSTQGTDNGSNIEIIKYPTDVTTATTAATSNSITVSWANPRGCFDRVVVVAREANAVESSINATSLTTNADFNTLFNANNDWSARSNNNDIFNNIGLGSDNTNYVVYNGTGTSFTLNNLTSGSLYYFRIFIVKGTLPATNWSPGVDVNSIAANGPSAGDLVITEIMYNPKDGGSISDATHEFLEIYNASSSPLSLRGVTISNAVAYSFTSGAYILSGEHIVVAQTAATFSGNGYQVFQWNSGTSLNNSGEPIVIKNASGVYIDSVNYANSSPWPSAANGNGPSAELKNYASDNNVGSSWGGSVNGTVTVYAATPGALNSLVGRPSTAATNMTFPTITTNRVTVRWTRGDGIRRIVVASPAALTATPFDNSNYNVSTVYGMGSVIGNGTVVFDGNGDSVVVSGLNASTNYFFTVFEYNLLSGLKKYLTTSSLSGSTTTSAASVAPTFTWAKSARGNKSDEILSTTTDANGNTYAVGYYTDTVIFGLDTLRSFGIQYEADVFIAKYDANGNVLWARAAGGYYGDRATGVAIDASGNPYIVGTFNSRIQFGTTTLTGSGADMFVAKYNTNGVFQWAVNGGGSNNDVGSGIGIDASGNIYATGYYLNSATFGSTSLTSNGNGDGYLVKLNSSGTVVWARTIGGTVFDAATALVVDRNNDITVTGYFCANAPSMTGPYNLKSSGVYDAFIVKFDPNGTVVWNTSIGGNESEIPSAIKSDYNNNLIVLGNYNGSLVSSGISYSNLGNSDIFMAKYNSFGSRSWLIRAGGSGSDLANGLYVDSAGNSYLTGSYNGLSSFGGTTVSSSTQNSFVSVYDANGNIRWVNRGTATVTNTGRAISGANGNVYFGGSFNGNMAFGANSLVASNNTGAFDSYIARISNSTPTMTSSPVMKADEPSFIDNRFRTEVAWVEATSTSANGWAVINWNTDRVFAGAKFEIQVSMDGSKWTTIATENATSASSINTYSKRVSSVDGAFYRVVMIGKDGNFDYSSMIPYTAKSAAKSLEFNVYPNPTSGILNVQFNGELNNNRMDIINVNGQVVYSTNVNGLTTSVDMSNLNPGVYMVRVNNGTETSVVRFTLVK